MRTVVLFLLLTAAWGQSSFNQLVIVPYSSTPTFNASTGTLLKITLTGNVTSSTIANATTGQSFAIEVCQDAVGGRTFVWPANTSGAAVVGAGVNVCTLQPFTYDGQTILAAASAGGGSGTPGGATTQVQTNTGGVFTGDPTFTHSNSTGETDVANLGSIRYVTPFYKFTYTDSGGSLGNLTSAGAGLTITLPCTSNAPCPAGIDTTSGSFTLGGTVSISSGLTTVTETSGQFFPNHVGLVIKIPTAGPAGGTLTSTIVSWTDSTHVVIATPASATVSGQTVSIGSYLYTVRISGTGTAEAAVVTGGTCTPLATSSCTLIISTQFAHPNGYTITSSTDGIQEAINDAWVSDVPFSAATAGSPYVKLMAGTQYNIYGTVYLRGWGHRFDGTGALIGCFTRDYCIYSGNWKGHPNVAYHTIVNPFLVPGLSATDIVGCGGATYCNVSSISNAGSIFTITTSGNHSFHGPANGVGADIIDCEISTTGVTAHFAGRIQAVTANTFQIALNGSGSFSNGVYTFGFCRPITAAINNNSGHDVYQNVQMMQVNSVNASASAAFGFGIVNENDQHFVIQSGSNRGSGIIDLTYPVSAFFYQRTDNGYAGIFNISDVELSNINCYTGGGNGMEWGGGSVCQGFPVFGIRYFGGLQPAAIENIYQETAGSTTNPLYGYGAAMGYLFQGSFGHTFKGTFPTGGVYPTFSCSGTAQAQRNYYVQAINGSSQSSAMVYIGSSQANCAGATINLAWPAPLGVDTSGASTGAITWNLMVTTGSPAVPPFGSSNTFLLFQSASPTCGANGMCTFADTQGATTTHTILGSGWGWKFWFFPSPFVTNLTTVYADIIGSRPGVVSSSGNKKISVIANQCIGAGANEQMSQGLVQCLNPDPSFASLYYQYTTAGGGAPANSKGFINWGPEVATFPVDLVTVGDSNWDKTTLTQGFRPANDAADIAIGEDQAGGYTTRSTTSISNYINAVNDNAAFLERLTATSKTIKVPLVAGGTAAGLTGTGACATFSGQVGGKWAGSAACASATAASTLTITPGLTAPNGWICSVYDETTRANLFQQTSHTTTTCVLTATSVTQNDVFVFSAIAY